MYSMFYTVNLGLCDYVPFSQIQSHILKQANCEKGVALKKARSFKVKGGGQEMLNFNNGQGCIIKTDGLMGINIIATYLGCYL